MVVAVCVSREPKVKVGRCEDVECGGGDAHHPLTDTFRQLHTLLPLPHAQERPSAVALADMLGMMRMAYKRKGMDGLQLPGW